MSKEVRKAMILAAGLGRRLQPATLNKPKALIEIKGVPLLQIVIERLKAFGIREIIINVHHHAGQIMDFVRKQNRFGLHIAFSVEEHLLDTGGGLKKARWFFEDCDRFLLHNVDILTDMDYGLLFRRLESTAALAALAVRRRKTTRYLLFDGQMRLVGWQNKKTGQLKVVRRIFPAFHPFAFSGIQALRSAIFDYLPEEDVFSMIDVYLSLAYRSLPVTGVITDAYRWLDVGKPQSLTQAETLFSDFWHSDAHHESS